MKAQSRTCVIGDPISHSRSPIIHGYWLRQHELAGSYEKCHVTAEGLSAFCERLREGEYVGANVTIPHKHAIIAHLDEVDQTATSAGAVNTIWRDGGRIFGTNTDIIGFLDNLDHNCPGWDHAAGTALVLGAGGAARGILTGLRQRGFERILVANRTFANARALVATRGGEAIPWSDIPQALKKATVLVNTTSLGMNGHNPLEIDFSAARSDLVVNDIVYVPIKTRLLEAASHRGLRCADGLGMLLHQAAPGFEKWFGVRPQVTEELRALIVADIEGHR